MNKQELDNLKIEYLKSYYKQFIEKYENDTIDNQSVGWYHLWMNSFRYYEASAKKNSHISDEEAVCYNFMCRFAIRKMQELKSDIHREFVEGHYYRQDLKRIAHKISNDYEIVKNGLSQKLENYPNSAFLWEWSEKQVEKIISELGYSLDSTVLCWAVFPAKWALVDKINKAFGELDIFESKPTSNLTNSTFFLLSDEKKPTKKKNKKSK